jgi:GNAT superfamily N-acetyltransferase
MINELRPINLKTDLAQLADLIELVFADSMDSSGRAALREMRSLSRFGPGLRLLSHMNAIAPGVHQGYVWIAGGRLVGNVSVYPAKWPADLGSAWIIANVGVHPDFQRRGIARRLMYASLDMIGQRGGTTAILQVDKGNDAAIHLYRSLGFYEERTWSRWQHRFLARSVQPDPYPDVIIRQRRRNEWRDEMKLAQRLRSTKQGGLGWLRPLHPSFFRRSLLQTLSDWINLHRIERQVVYSTQNNRLLGACWIETGFIGSSRLTLFVEPEFQGRYDDALLRRVIDHAGRNTLVIEHPDDEPATIDVLKRHGFTNQRTTIHMRWDVP